MFDLPKYSQILGKRVLSLDYGTKFTGTGIYLVGSDPYPTPLGRIKYESNSQLISQILRVQDEEFAQIIVLGIPFFTDGSASTLTKTIIAFGEKLKSQTNSPVYFVDETLTTFEAEQRMQKSPQYNFKIDPKKVDALSASIILEEFINKTKATV